MEITMVKETVDLPKELNEVRTFLSGLAESIMNKDVPAAEKLMAQLPALMTAVDGYEKLPEEAKTAEADNVYALLLRDLKRVFTK